MVLETTAEVVTDLRPTFTTSPIIRQVCCTKPLPNLTPVLAGGVRQPIKTTNNCTRRWLLAELDTVKSGISLMAHLQWSSQRLGEHNAYLD